MLRLVQQVVPAVPTSDGAGVKLYRSIGSRTLPQTDPFLLLDEFKSAHADDYIAGFPDHPHRGFETVTYMLHGKLEHKDHAGNHGILHSGSVQWMTAGRGIVHSEMPMQVEGLLWGFQLWINLPAREKMCEPRYQDIPTQLIPRKDLDNGSQIRVIAGTFEDLEGPVEGIITNPLFLDVQIPAKNEITVPLSSGHNAICYFFDGSARMGATNTSRGLLVEERHLAVLESKGDEVRIETDETSARLLIISAAPIKEPICRAGPFVMNTRQEILQAFEDFRNI